MSGLLKTVVAIHDCVLVAAPWRSDIISTKFEYLHTWTEVAVLEEFVFSTLPALCVLQSRAAAVDCCL
jgi:hypothetical protein